MGVVLTWSLKRIINMICDILLNKFDCFIMLIKVFINNFNFKLTITLIIFYIVALLLSLIITSVLFKIFRVVKKRSPVGLIKRSESDKKVNV